MFVATYAAATLSGVVANAALHALTASVTVTSSPLNTGGSVFMGVLSQRVNRTAFADYNTLAQRLIDRRELKPMSLYQCAAGGKSVSSYPVDMITWAAQNPLTSASATLSDNHATDGLGQLALVFTPGTPTDVSITAYTEWRINFNDAALSSTSIKRPTTPNGVWNGIIGAAHSVGGFLEGVTHAAGALQAVTGPAMAAYSALRPIAGELQPLLALGA